MNITPSNVKLWDDVEEKIVEKVNSQLTNSLRWNVSDNTYAVMLLNIWGEVDEVLYEFFDDIIGVLTL